MAIETRNPATGTVEKQFEPLTAQEVEAAITRSATAYSTYCQTTFAERAAILRKAADIIEADLDHYATLATLEMGKTFVAAKGELLKSALVCRYYADEAQEFLADDHVKTEAQKSYRRYLPLGPVLAVMPWNFPYWQVFRFAAPALMAGNTALLKHASNVPQVALAIEDIFTKAGAPDGAFQTLLIGSSQVEAVLRDERVKAATLTGSEPAGAAVAKVCGEEIKPTVLELGGADPFIIMPSADLEAAMDTAISARVMNNGQSCIAAKRFIVHADIYDTVKAGLVERFNALKIGDPMDADTDVGPMVNAAARSEIAEQVETALAHGAKRVCGAEVMSGEGYYFSPGLIENVTPASPVFHAEFFGPVAMMFKVNSIEKAVTLSNDSPFGLGSSIFTRDEDEMTYAIDHIEAGATFVNAKTSSDVRLPFGGIKRSGYGRELAAEGIRAFCNLKTVLIA